MFASLLSLASDASFTAESWLLIRFCTHDGLTFCARCAGRGGAFLALATSCLAAAGAYKACKRWGVI